MANPALPKVLVNRVRPPAGEAVLFEGTIRFQEDGQRIDFRDYLGVTTEDGAVVRSGTVAIANGVSEVEVEFSSAFASDEWKLRSIVIVNATDGDPMNIMPGTIKLRSDAGFTVILSGETNSANYVLEYKCELGAEGDNLRSGSVDLANGSGSSVVEVEFDTPLPGAGWRIRNLCVVNTTDGNPANIIAGLVKLRTDEGFTVLLSGETDSANYKLEYSCEY